MKDRASEATIDPTDRAPSCPPAAQQARYEAIPCPVCHSVDCTEVAGWRAMEAEDEWLREFHRRRLRPRVPPERLTDRLSFSQCPPIRLTQCRSCSHLYRNPAEARESLEASYRENGPDREVLEELFEAQSATYESQVARLTRVAGGPRQGLEIGSFAGGFLTAATRAGWQFEGIDINADAVAFAREKGLRVTQTELAGLPGSGVADAIAIWNTFEQLYDVEATLTAARRLVREGGILALRIPNGEFYLDWRRRLHGALAGIAVRVLAHNNLLRFPYRQGFTRESLRTLLARHRFAPVRAFGDTLVNLADEWTTTYGRLEERAVKAALRWTRGGWKSPWVEVYSRAIP
jgi:SAM-dependent methyltransferase